MRSLIIAALCAMVVALSGCECRTYDIRIYMGERAAMENTIGVDRVEDHETTVSAAAEAGLIP